MTENKRRCRIQVSRPDGAYKDKLRRYSIEVDGKNEGRLKEGGQVAIDVSPGKHTVRAAIDWTGSELIEIHLKENEIVKLAVKPAGNAFSLWQLFKKNSYLTLELIG